MPTRAPKRCTRPGCQREQGTHQHQAPKPPRPTRQELGYDEEWLAISAAYLAEHPECEVRWCTRESRHVDHIDGDTSNREEWNLQALCVQHHSRKTVQHDGGFGRPKTRRDRDGQ